MPKKLENTFWRRLVKQACLEVLQKKSSTLLGVVWAWESKTGLGFEIRPRQQKFQGFPNVHLMGNPAVAK